MTHFKTALIGMLLLTSMAPTSQAKEMISESGYSEVMLNLVESMQNIVFGIMVEDYEQVENIAEDIAYHPGPELEKRIALLKKLNFDALSFKQHEDKIRQNALNLMQAAAIKDRVRTLERYAELARSCTECHITYREKVRSFIKKTN